MHVQIENIKMCVSRYKIFTPDKLFTSLESVIN